MNNPRHPRPFYDQALAALQTAHDACFKHPDRDVLGMSHGPFSGVNVALGIIDDLEEENRVLRSLLDDCRNKIVQGSQNDDPGF